MENFISQIQALSMADAEMLAELSQQLGYKTEVNNLFIRTNEILQSKNDSIFVATAEDKIIGFINAFKTVRIETPVFIEIAALVVDEKNRKQHIGENLIAAAVKWADGLGIHKIVVRCNVLRKETHRFYERLGFVEVKEQKVFEIVRGSKSEVRDLMT